MICRFSFVWLIAAMALVCLSTDAQGQATVGSRRGPLPENFKAFVHKTMPYRLWTPQTQPDRKYPLVLCLHGAGGRGDDNRGRGTEAAVVLTTEKVQSDHPSFILTPQCPKNSQWVNVPWGKGAYDTDQVKVSDPMALAMEILKHVMDKYPIDPDRVYVTGQSMGGYGTWDAIVRYPKLFAAAVPVCGGGDPSKAKLIRDLPIWNFHGANDRTVPIQGSRAMQAALKDINPRAKFTELEGVGHIAWKRAWRTDGLVDWLFAQKRKATGESPDQD